jgi:hypothetical protein
MLWLLQKRTLVRTTVLTYKLPLVFVFYHCMLYNRIIKIFNNENSVNKSVFWEEKKEYVSYGYMQQGLLITMCHIPYFLPH